MPKCIHMIQTIFYFHISTHVPMVLNRKQNMHPNISVICYKHTYSIQPVSTTTLHAHISSYLVYVFALFLILTLQYFQQQTSMPHILTALLLIVQQFTFIRLINFGCFPCVAINIPDQAVSDSRCANYASLLALRHLI